MDGPSSPAALAGSRFGDCLRELGLPGGSWGLAAAFSPDGSSLIYRPRASDRAANGCTPMPTDASRDDVRAAGAQVVIVGSCAPGWSADVFDWNASHVESGSTSGYQAYPACDASYGAGVYDSEMVRYFEDSTLVSALLDPTRKPADPEALTPAKVQDVMRMTLGHFPAERISGHFHDTYGQALANVYASLLVGIHHFDTSIAGLGGCPYAPGATGNVSTEDVVYMLHGLGIDTGLDLDALIDTGQWISDRLGRQNASRVGRAVLAKRA